MGRFKITSILVSLLLLGLAQINASSNGKGKPTLDLEDYIDSPNSNDNKKEDLSTSATGYYGHGHHHHQPVYHGHGHSGYHQHYQPVYHSHGAHGAHHHHHNPYDYGHAQTYLVGEYGGHVGSAHVSYGTEINHGHSHQHHHSHGYYG